MITTTLERYFPLKVGGYDLPQWPQIVDDEGRSTGQDIRSLPDIELVVERRRLEAALPWPVGRRQYVASPDAPDGFIEVAEWMTRRLAMIAAEVRRRRAARR